MGYTCGGAPEAWVGILSSRRSGEARDSRPDRNSPAPPASATANPCIENSRQQIVTKRFHV